MSDKSILLVLAIITLVVFLFFYLSYRNDKTRLINGTIFNIFLISLYGTILIGSLLYSNILLIILVAIIGIPLLILFTFGSLILIIGCLINAKIVLKRERKSFANMLTLGVGIGLLTMFILETFNIGEVHPIIRYFMGYISLIVIYFLLSFFNYFLTSVLYSIYRPKLDKDYIIVLGSGLIDGNKVSKLLGGRIDKAIEFYKKQKDIGKDSKIIFSGGQGKDETVSEAVAMKEYTINKGINKADLIIEDKSKSTLENFKFSKEIMDNSEKQDYKAVFSTSSYHVFRAAIYAKKVNLKAPGIGAKTAFYYLPNAVIREYIAIVLMKKRNFLLKIALITMFYMGNIMLEYLVLN